MSMIKRFAFWRHLRAEPTSHIVLWKGGTKRRSGPGLAFWFSPLGASIAEIPLEDRDLTFIFQCRSGDFQDVTSNGVVTFRVRDPERLAQRIDFSIDTQTGRFNADPLDKLSLIVRELSQQLAASYLLTAPLRTVLSKGVDGVRGAIVAGLAQDETLPALGLEIVGVRVTSVLPTSEMEKALQAPTREGIQQSADEASFQRRAAAVMQERSIQENELGNQIELAKQEETLISQRGQNERKRASEAAASKGIESEAAAQAVKVNAEAQAESIKLLEESRVNAERERMDIYKALPPSALMGLAARELAGKLTSIEHLSLTPDMLGGLLQRVLGAQAKRLEET